MYIFKDCNENYFGPNCELLCNTTCNRCNKTTGVCESGCYPGWEGTFCHEGDCLSIFYNTSILDKLLEMLETILNIGLFL